MPDLSVRSRRTELMDDPDLDRGRHREALEALSRINRISRAGTRLWREVESLARRRPGEAVRVLDLACGGGDVILDVAARAREAGIATELHGCDVSPVAVGRARGAAAASDAGDMLQFHELDVLADPLPDGYDLVTSCLFLHHLARSEAITLLRRMARATSRRVFVQDLRRTRLGYFLAWVGLHTLTRSDVARVDGLRSVQGAFTIAEVRSICAEARLQGAEVCRSWPQRFTVRWERTDAR